MTQLPKRLIEVDLPIKRISAYARQEKSTSTITGLHLWWARRPLAACRAVVCAALWPDPADDRCPSAFRHEAAKASLDFGARVTVDREAAALCGDSWSAWRELTPGAVDVTTSQGCLRVRELLLGFIERFSNPRSVQHPAFVDMAHRVTAAANTALNGPDSPRPLVFDPFAGGGSIPLEALRIGAAVVAADTNPVALLINDVLIRLAPRVRDRAREREVLVAAARQIIGDLGPLVASLYPEREGRVTVAYLWARTVLSEAPGATDLPIEVPLIRSMWLSKRPGNTSALRWGRDERGKIACEPVQATYADGTSRTVLRPRLEIFHPARDAVVEPGTASGGGATCPVTSFTTPKASVRAQLMPRRGGTRDARLIAVATRPRAGVGRQFHAASALDEVATRHAADRFTTLSRKVDEPLPVGRVWKNNPFRVHNYGMTAWGDLFTERQHVVLSLLAERVAAFGETANGDPTKEITQAVLALTVARLADHLNSGCRWNPTGEKLQQLFARQAVPMVWDFCEANPFGGSVGDWLGMVEGAADAMDFVPITEASADVQQASAAACPLPDDSVDATITDPPYYDAVPYADLSEFFYVWLRRCAPIGRRAWFETTLVDRSLEIVFDENRGKDASFYVRLMTAALREARRVTKPNGVGVVVFAHKSTAGWEALLQAMLDAGWVVTASWPIDTELATRVRAMGSAALASSVHLVCRPREDSDGSVSSPW